MIVFTVNEHRNICIAGLDRQAGYATADDTVLFCSGRDASTIVNELNNEIWLQDNRLFLNTVKTESMLIGTRAKVSKVINMWNGILIKRVYQFKYLGVTFDEHLSWNMHVGELI